MGSKNNTKNIETPAFAAPNKRKKAVNVAFVAEDGLIDRLDNVCKRLNKSRSRFVREAVAFAVEEVENK